MGQSKQKKNDARSIAFQKTDRCIFCGGHVEATTVDHCPPRSAFQNKGWPEGFVFPACIGCNGGSSRDDKVFAFLVNLNSEKEAEQDRRRFDQIILELKRDYPDEIKVMLGMGGADKKALAERLGLSKPAGVFYRDLPFVRIPDSFKDMALRVGRKITKAVHFSESNIICPEDADIECMLVSNVMSLENPISRDITDSMGRSHHLVRSGRDISRQFSYLCKKSEDGSLGIYIFQFNHSFQILSAYSAAPKGLDFMRGKLAALVAADEASQEDEEGARA